MREKLKYFLFGLTIILLLWILLWLTGCKTLSTDLYLQQNRVDSRKTTIYGADGKKQGYLQQSHIDRRRTIQYDKNGKAKGYWQRDYVDPRKTRFYKKK